MTLDNPETHFIKRNQQILLRSSFVVNSPMDKWHTLVVWKHIKDRSVIDRNVENPKDDLNYISAVSIQEATQNLIQYFMDQDC